MHLLLSMFLIDETSISFHHLKILCDIVNVRQWEPLNGKSMKLTLTMQIKCRIWRCYFTFTKCQYSDL